MSLAAILDLAASCLGFFSALFFCVGILHFTQSRAEEIATLFWGKGEAIAKEMLLQKSDFIVGAFLLMLSFFVQIVIKAFPSILSQVVVQEQILGLAIAVAIASALTIFARILNLHLGKVFLQQHQARTEGKL